jgi:LuxR family transcriptional regulator, maltose regulon positive regulatory protein
VAAPIAEAEPTPDASNEDVLERVLHIVPDEIKLRPPEPRPGILRRPEVMARLRESDAAVTFVVAPAGYGKTAVLAEWARADERPFAWLSVSDRENDPAVLLAYLALALDSVEPLDARTFASLASPDTDLTSMRLPRLGKVLARRSYPFVLVLDDVHLLRESAPGAVLEALAEHIPNGSQLVLAGRSDPPVSLAAIRARQGLHRIGPENLAMSEHEAGALLSRAGVRLDGSTLESVILRTEGWPAGLTLAGIALRESPDPVAAAGRFAGDDRVVAEYLRDEVLRVLPEQRRDFLVCSSVLDRLSARICDSVLERSDSGRVLEELRASSLLLFPLDRRGEWYRFHHLLRDMLRGELKRRGPELERSLHERASAWLEEHGDIDGALDHTRAAGDLDRAAGLVWRNSPGYLGRGRTATVTRWLEPFTRDEIAASPPLALAAAWWSLTAGDTESIDHWTSLAEHGGDALLPDGTPLRSAVALLRAIVGKDGLSQVRDDAARAFELDRADSPFRPTARLLEGGALRVLGDHDLARARLDNGIRIAGALQPAAHAQCLGQLALLEIDAGGWSEAASLVGRATKLVDRYGLGDRPAMASVHATAALSHARQGETMLAQTNLKHGLWLLERLVGVGPWFAAGTTILLARAALALGDLGAARMLVREAERVLARYPDSGNLPDRLREIERMTDASAMPVGLAAAPLTPAEMRVLRYLPTHLSFEAIAEELIVSRNTVKTQAIAAYRKLGVSSRAEAVEQARELGLLDE